MIAAFPHRVLVVDDEETIRIMLVQLLEDAGYEVKTAARISEARSALADDAYDLIMLDKNLPDGTGLELAREVRDRHLDTAVILVTGFASLDSALEAIGLQIWDYVTKPFDVDHIVERIAAVLVRLEAQRTARSRALRLELENQELQDLAARDALTRLFNHAYMQEFIEKELVRSVRYKVEFGLILIDVDNFKKVNDEFGHPAGDRVIKVLAEILRGEGRESDLAFRLRAQDVAARYGGDEFALVLPETDKRGTSAKAERLRQYLRDFDFATQRIPSITLSMGVACYPEDGGTRNELVNAADQALYAAKKAGRDRVIVSTPELLEKGEAQRRAAEQQIDRIQALNETIQHGRFSFVYQPIVAANLDVFGYECFCRPDDEKFESPAQLLVTAERAGRVADLGLALRRKATKPLAELEGSQALFVNLHPFEVNEGLLAWGGELGALAKRVVLEVTETSAIRDYSRVSKLITDLKEIGFRVALDNLQGGYAGLDALATLAPDFVKVDVGFLSTTTLDQRVARLVRHLTDYVNGEGMQLVAGNIESPEQRDLAVEIGCHLLQGYLFAEPGSAFPTVKTA